MIEVEVLFVESGEVGANGAKGGGSLQSAEAAGDLLFDFAHADRLFGDIIGERRIGVESKSEHIVLIRTQARQQIRCIALPSSTASAGRRGRRVKRLSRCEDAPVLGAQSADPFLRQAASRSGVHFGVGLVQQVDHLLWPGVLAGLGNRSQFADMMGIAQRMLAGRVIAVRHPAIVTEDARKAGDESELLNRFATSLGVHAHPGRDRRRQRMQPVQFAGHPHSRLIGARRHRQRDPVGDTRHRRRQYLCSLVDHTHDRPCGDGQTVQIVDQPGGTFYGHHLVLSQMNHQRLDPRSVLGWPDDTGRKYAAMCFAAATASFLNAMLGDGKRRLRYIEDLPTILQYGNRRLIEGSSAGITCRWQRMDDYCIGRRRAFERRPLVTRLPALFEPTDHARRRRHGFRQPVRSRRLARVATVLRQPVLEFSYARHQLYHFKLQRPQSAYQLVLLGVAQSRQIWHLVHALYHPLHHKFPNHQSPQLSPANSGVGLNRYDS